MTAIDLRELLEQELSWRTNELSFLKNILNEIQDDKHGIYYKSLILALYSHFEGFIKSSLLIYIDYLNKLNLKRDAFNENLIVASMETIFKNYDNLQKKNSYFKKTFPQEVHLHRFSRRIDLINNLNLFLQELLKIPDEAVNTESNLGYEVLEKALYKIGINHTIFSDYKLNINTLLSLRNSIAHTGNSSSIDSHKYNSLEQSVLFICEAVILKLYDIASNKKYKSNTCC